MPLSPEAAQRIYKVMVYLAGADGLDAEEAQVLEGFAASSGLDGATTVRLMQQGLRKSSLEAPACDEEQAAMIGAMIEVVAADGCLDHHEQERLVTLAEDLAIPAAAMRERLLERLMGG